MEERRGDTLNLGENHLVGHQVVVLEIRIAERATQVATGETDEDGSTSGVASLALK